MKTFEEHTPVSAPVVQVDYVAKIGNFIVNHVPKITADSLEWLTIVVLHCTTIPSLMALMTGLTDRTPGIDVVLFVWSGLILMFARAIILKNRMNIVTNGVGFMAQAFALAFILFK